MLKLMMDKLKESIFSIAPVYLIVLIIGLTPLGNFTLKESITFSLCAVFLIIGMSLFNLGADISMTPIGEFSGSGLTRKKKLWLLLLASFLLGLFITIAEPDLSVLAEQVKTIINNTLLIVTVGIGVGIFLTISILKIVFKRDLSLILMFFYMVLFMLSSLLILSGKNILIPMSYDSGGVTTGPITVPFIMAFGVGIASSIGGKRSRENSFGLIALCSIGPILAVMLLCLISNGTLQYELNDYSIDSGLGINTLKIIFETSLDTLKALGLIVIFFFILNFTILKLPKKKINGILIGLLFTFIGLVIFLSAVEIGFMPIGFKLGCSLASSKIIVVIFAFVVGMVTVLAEPAVHVLNNQVEEITDGIVTKKSMLIALSVGVGLSICLSVVRVIYDFSLLYYVIPGYLISLGLSFFVPKLYTSIAFDSGGVASGPLTSSFILPFLIGVCYTLYSKNEILSLAFGVVSMVALAPLITIQLLGFRAIISRSIRNRISMKRILDSSDKEIIYFDIK